MAQEYPFDILSAAASSDNVSGLLAQRPFVSKSTDTDASDGAARSILAEDAKYYSPDPGLVAAINAAIALGQPLLLSGEPGTGKSSAAYYIAEKLGLKPVLFWTVRSNAQAGDLKGRYNAVGYMGAELREQRLEGTVPNQDDFWENGVLVEAFQSETPRVVLIDEIDKAPRDFPNDLLEELDQWRIDFPELQHKDPITVTDEKRPIVVITSNGERMLPDAFLRRCVYWHIKMDQERIKNIIKRRVELGKIKLPDDVVAGALDLFESLVKQGMEKKPSVSELINWLRILESTGQTKRPLERDDVANAVLLKTEHDQRT